MAPVITQIMNAVFLEEVLSWDKERRLSLCSITIHNYTARARAYTILAKWPESSETSMEFNPEGGGKRLEGCGLGDWTPWTLELLQFWSLGYQV